jgi:hypothetical protein
VPLVAKVVSGVPSVRNRFTRMLLPLAPSTIFWSG